MQLPQMRWFRSRIIVQPTSENMIACPAPPPVPFGTRDGGPPPFLYLSSLRLAEPVVMALQWSVHGKEIAPGESGFGKMETADRFRGGGGRDGWRKRHLGHIDALERNAALTEPRDVGIESHGQSWRVGVGRVLSLKLLRDL